MRLRYTLQLFSTVVTIPFHLFLLLLIVHCCCHLRFAVDDRIIERRRARARPPAPVVTTDVPTMDVTTELASAPGETSPDP